MTPFGKPLGEIDIANIQRLIDDEVPEGRHLEYKSDIPVSDEEQRRQRNAGETQPLDRSWTKGRPIMDYGRDKLMEEFVAFSHADGGALVLGMRETDSKPSCAAGFNALPDVAGLERRLRDAIISCIEPCLPYAAVRAISLDAAGNGIVLIEIEPSRLGPHRVRRTREATIRREDSCIPMSMEEIHDMVLRNARRFDVVNARFDELSGAFSQKFIETLGRNFDHRTVTGARTEDRVAAWIASQQLAAFGLQVSLVPHSDLGIPRLEHLAGLAPNTHSVVQTRGGRDGGVSGAEHVWLGDHGERRVLGGVVQVLDLGDLSRNYRVQRDGQVDASVIFWGPRTEVHVPIDWAVAMLACVLQIYDRLRETASSPSMPAEIDVEMLVLGTGVTTRVGGPSFIRGSSPLGSRVQLPRYTASDRASFAEAMNEIAGDLANAGGMSSKELPRYEIVWI